VDHLLFRCPLAVFLRAVVSDAMNWGTIPLSVKIFMEDFMLVRGDKRNKIMVFLFGAICWTL
jgi:hypothetical protein